MARSHPLSWPALVARARLAEAGAPIPPTIDPPEAAPATEPLSIKLPPPVDMLHRIGLDADAEDALRERENVVTGTAFGRGLEALCDAYGQLGRARRRYQVAQQVPSAMLAAAPWTALAMGLGVHLPHAVRGSRARARGHRSSAGRP